MWCLTVGLALTLAVPDSGMAVEPSTSSTLSEQITQTHRLQSIRDVVMKEIFHVGLFTVLLQFVFKASATSQSRNIQFFTFLRPVSASYH